MGANFGGAGTMTDELRNFLKFNLPNMKGWKKIKFIVGIMEPKVGFHITQATKNHLPVMCRNYFVPCDCNSISSLTNWNVSPPFTFCLAVGHQTDHVMLNPEIRCWCGCLVGGFWATCFCFDLVDFGGFRCCTGAQVHWGERCGLSI